MTIQLSPKQLAMTQGMADDPNPQVAQHASTILDLYEAGSLDWRTFNGRIEAAKKARGQTPSSRPAQPASTSSTRQHDPRSVIDWQRQARNADYRGYIPDHPDYWYTAEAIRLDLAAKDLGYMDHNAYAAAQDPRREHHQQEQSDQADHQLQQLDLAAQQAHPDERPF